MSRITSPVNETPAGRSKRYPRGLFVLCVLVLALCFSACETREPPSETDEPVSEYEKESPPELKTEEDLSELPDDEESEPEEEEPDTEGVQAAAEKLLAALQSGDPDRIRGVTDYTNLLQLQGSQSDANLRALLRTMRYEIGEIEVEGNAAKAQVNITNVDMHQMLPGYLKQAMDLEYNNGLSAEPKSAEQMDVAYQELFAQLLKQHAADTLARSVELSLVRADEQWRTQLDDTFRAAVFGDFWNASQQVGANAGGGQR